MPRQIKPNGFTLIETLIVLMIVSIMIAGTMFSLNGLRQRESDEAVERLRRSLAFAAQTAEIRGQAIRVEFLPHAYRFSALSTTGEWQLLFAPNALKERTWHTGLGLAQLKVENVVMQTNPQLVFAHESPSFELTLNTEQGLVRLQGSESGTVTQLKESS